MKLVDIMKSDKVVTMAKIGKPPYLYQVGEKDTPIYAAQSIPYIIRTYEDTVINMDDINVYAYGFKVDENDPLEYVDATVLSERYRKSAEADVFECVEENGDLSYMSFDTILFFYKTGRKMIVNGKPIDAAIKEAMAMKLQMVSDVITHRIGK